MGPNECAQAEQFVLKTPQTRNPAGQPQHWNGPGGPKSYMSPTDFNLSPMSMRLLRGNRQKVLVSAKLMDLPENPGFITEDHGLHPMVAQEDKENKGASLILPKKIEAQRGGANPSKKGLSPAPLKVNQAPAVAGMSKRAPLKGLSERTTEALGMNGEISR